MFKTYSSSSSLVITSCWFATSRLVAPVSVTLVYWLRQSGSVCPDCFSAARHACARSHGACALYRDMQSRNIGTCRSFILSPIGRRFVPSLTAQALTTVFPFPISTCQISKTSSHLQYLTFKTFIFQNMLSIFRISWETFGLVDVASHKSDWTSRLCFGLVGLVNH